MDGDFASRHRDPSQMNVRVQNLLPIFQVNDLRATAIRGIGIERPRVWSIRVCLIRPVEDHHVIAAWQVSKFKRLRVALIAGCASLFLRVKIGAVKLDASAGEWRAIWSDYSSDDLAGWHRSNIVFVARAVLQFEN